MKDKNDILTTIFSMFRRTPGHRQKHRNRHWNCVSKCHTTGVISTSGLPPPSWIYDMRAFRRLSVNICLVGLRKHMEITVGIAFLSVIRPELFPLPVCRRHLGFMTCALSAGCRWYFIESDIVKKHGIRRWNPVSKCHTMGVISISGLPPPSWIFVIPTFRKLLFDL